MNVDLTKIKFPQEFYEFLIKDIEPECFLEATIEYPELQSTIFSGFSLSKKKIKRIVQQQKVQTRIKNLACHSGRFLDFLLKLWGKRNKEKVDFLECLKPEYILSNFDKFKNLFGPHEFFCMIYNSSISDDRDFVDLFESSYWLEDTEEKDVPEGFLSPFKIVADLLERRKDEGPTPSGSSEEDERVDVHERAIRKKLEKKLKKQQEIVKSLEAKIQKLNQRHKKDAEDLKRYKELVSQYKVEMEKEKDRIEQIVRREKRRAVKELFSYYEEVPDFNRIESFNKSLDTIFEHTEKALKLQQEADREYGKISELRTKLIRLDQYLDEISKIYNDSVFIHGEIRKVKRLLEEERDRILSLPRAEMFFANRRDSTWEHDLVRRLSLLEPTPRALQQLKCLKTSIKDLSAIGLDFDTDYVYSALEKKENAILGYLSGKFCSEFDPDGDMEIVTNLDEFMKNKTSRAYDLYIDAYNILLTANENSPISEEVFKDVRQRFTKAVVRLGSNFNRVYLVFDGIVSDKEKYGNVEVIFADKYRGENADEVIIRLLNRRKDNKAILATADREIINQTKHCVFATIEPHSFFSCLYDYGFTVFPFCNIE